MERNVLLKSVRLWTAAVILVVIGAGVGVKLLVADRLPGASEVATITAACPQCHGGVPTYGHVSAVHDRHASFDCSRCHGGGGALRVSDATHEGIRWLGIGVLVLAVAGVVASVLMMAKKGKAR